MMSSAILGQASWQTNGGVSRFKVAVLQIVVPDGKGQIARNKVRAARLSESAELSDGNRRSGEPAARQLVISVGDQWSSRHIEIKPVEIQRISNDATPVLL